MNPMQSPNTGVGKKLCFDSDEVYDEYTTLGDVLPFEFYSEFMDTPAAKLLDIRVVATIRTSPWVGSHKNVFVWWELANGKAVAWNENPARGWSFPVVKMK